LNIWAQRALLLSLAPVLLAQGKYARAVTPRLREPPGEREGCAGSGPLLRLLIAGDSAAAGVGVEHQQTALSGQLAAALAPYFGLHWRLIAQTGYTTRDLLLRLAQEPAQTFDVAVLSLGVNDVTGAVRAGAWLARQRQLVRLLQQRFGVRRVVLSSVPPMHQLRALPQPLRAVLGARARRFNAGLAGAVQSWRDCALLPMALPLDAEALASDGFHPGRATYREWALQLAEVVKRAAGEAAVLAAA
jgi:lysophospholipase L1-like esterase